MAGEGSTDKIVFVSYATLDQERHKWLDRLKLQVEPLLKPYQFELWDASRIKLGHRWKPEIKKALNRAVAAVLLVGPAFLASKFITEIELPMLLKRAQDDQLPLLILYTQHANIKESGLTEFQIFNPIPLEDLPESDQNKILKDFSQAIKECVEKCPPNRPGKVPHKLSKKPPKAVGRGPNKPGKVRHNLSITVKPTNVVGRGKEVEKVLSALVNNEEPVILASGFAGVGKSTVAQVVAWKFVERRQPFKFIAWVDLRPNSFLGKVKPINLEFVLDSIAKAANPVSEIVAIGDVEVKVARVRDLLSATHSLLILDNYESLLKNPKEEEKVADFVGSLPIGPSDDESCTFIRVLITSRIVSPKLERLPVYQWRLDKLPFKDALKMMRSQPDNPNLTQGQWKRVWEILRGLPKYMQVARDQLKSETISDWMEKITEIPWPPVGQDDFFSDLFDFSWRNPLILSEDLKQILLAMTYFAGHARSNELRLTSGLEKGRFRNALPSRYNASYLEVVRKVPGQEYYTLHPLMYSYCRAALNSKEFREFRGQACVRFVDCFLNFAKDASKKAALYLLDEESQNIVAAARIGERLKLWEELINFRKYMRNFLRNRGYWIDFKEIVELTVKACHNVGNEGLLAECFVDDLAWYYLRLEDVQTARKFIKKGLLLFKKLQHWPGIAQAKRHLGKAALLDGLDEQYKPKELADNHFARAEKYYKESMAIQKKLQKKGDDRQLAIADMKLDFGRLYWLQGIKYEQDGRLQHDAILLKTALKKYKKANSISKEARSEFEHMSLSKDVTKPRIAKAWGNQGNATKEIASYMTGNNELSCAKKYVDTAKLYYGKNLSLGEEILKKDEIAHALAGLAEVGIIESSRIDPFMQTGKRKLLLKKAKKDAQKAHRLYEEMAGPMGERDSPVKKTRDEIRTEWLIDEIRRYSNSESPKNTSSIP